MSNWTSFSDINLHDVKAGTGLLLLDVGNHNCRVSDVEIGIPKSGRGHTLMVELASTAGSGTIRDWMNIDNANEMAERIAKEKLKSLLEFGDHPSPDKPGDIKSLLGLTVGVTVGMSKERKGPDGTVYPSRREVKGFHRPSNGEYVPGSSAEDDAFDDPLNFG